MTITLEIAGGLAPPAMARRLVVDAATLRPVDRAALVTLIGAALRVPARAPNEAARDVRSYDITIESDDGVRRILAWDGVMPADVRRLIELILKLAR